MATKSEPDRKTPEEVLRDIKKQNPNVRIYKASDEQAQLQIQRFGVREIDELCRGMLCGGYTILYGPNKAGKSTLMAKAIAQMQRDGRFVLLVDLEGRMDPDWLIAQGVDTSNLCILTGGKDFEENMNVVTAQIQEGVFDAIAIDSLSAQSPRGEIEDKKGKKKGLEDDTVALLARQLSKWFRKITPAIARLKIPVVLLSQVRAANIHAGAYLDMTGGNAPKHWGSTILQIGRASKIEATKDGKKTELGFWLKAKLKKTSLCSNEGKEVQVPLYFGIGIDDLASTVRRLLQDGVIKQGASSAVTFQEKTYRSENQLVTKARDNSELAAALQDALEGVLVPAEEVSEGDAVLPSEAVEAGAAGSLPTEGNLPDLRAKGSESVEADAEYICTIDECGQVAKTARGLKTHQTRMHGKST